MSLRGVLVLMAVMAVTLVMSLAFPVLRNPVVILAVALGSFTLTREKDRPTVIRLGVAGSTALAFLVWSTS